MSRESLHGIVEREVGTLAVRHPHAQCGALQALQHDGARLLHMHLHTTSRLDLDEARLLRLHDAFPWHEVQLRHQLAPVADAQREGVRASVERLELCLQVLVEQNRCCSVARRLQHVRVAEPAHEHLQ